MTTDPHDAPILHLKYLQPEQYLSWTRKADDPEWTEHRYRTAQDRAMVSAICELRDTLANLAAAEKRAADAEAQVKALSSPVTRHNEADGILQRYFITGGRQYRYNKQDCIDLKTLVNEWIAARLSSAKEKP